MAEQIWDDLKVAFSYDDEDAFEEWAGPLDKCGGELPDGWSLCETDATGGRCVAIFRVEGSFSDVAAQRVADLMEKFQAPQLAP